MNNNVSKLFVYGSLRSGFHHAAYEYISKHFTLSGEAKVQGKLYDLGEYPAAVPAAEAVFITGELYELKVAGEFDWAIEQLDDYEGLNPEEGEAPLYKREVSEVIYNGNETKAWMYWYVGDVAGKSIIPSGDYFDSLYYQNKL